jgi:hypothetical protein
MVNYGLFYLHKLQGKPFIFLQFEAFIVLINCGFMPIRPNQINAGFYAFKAKKAHVRNKRFAFGMKMERTMLTTAN